jgi:hypothetical protein
MTLQRGSETSDVLTPVTIRITPFWNVMLHSPVDPEGHKRR